MGLINWLTTNISTIAIAIALAWILIVFVRRVREPRVAIRRDTVDGPDLELASVVAGEFQKFRDEGGGSRLEIIQNVDREVDVPIAFAAFGVASLTSRLSDLLRRSYAVDIRYGRRRASEIVIVATLSHPLGRLLSSRVFSESEFKVLEDAVVEERPDAKVLVAPTSKTADAAVKTSLAVEPSTQTTAGNGAGGDEGSGGAAVQKSTDITAGDTEPPQDTDLERERRQRLGIAVAAWAAYELSRGRAANRAAWLTTDWRSYALFRFGADWQEEGKAYLARRAYAEALSADAGNRGALFNLAMIDAHAGCHFAAWSRLGSARRETERAASAIRSGIALDRLWYRTMYNIAATYRHAELDKGAAGPECRLAADRPEAIRVATELLQQSAYTILALKRRRQSRAVLEHAPLLRFLTVAQVSAKVLLDDLLEAPEPS